MRWEWARESLPDFMRSLARVARSWVSASGVGEGGRKKVFEVEVEVEVEEREGRGLRGVEMELERAESKAEEEGRVLAEERNLV